MCFTFSFGRTRSPQPRETKDKDEEESGIQHVKVFTYKELKRATNDFIPSNKIGQGGFGHVYKGRLTDGRIVAVKVLSSESTQGSREFLTEISLISNIQHENLVVLHGCCVEGDHRILVYGFVENNSLAHTLLCGRQNGLDFSWKVRRKICIGVARGLAFLHEEVKHPIVHRDIKASNILLDEDLNPKISDFGLAKLIPPSMTHVSTRVAGTIGYLAPEYAIRGHLTRRADVYSFGVLLLEIVSGRCNYNSRLPIGDQFLLEKTWELYEAGRLLEVVDYSLENYDSDEATRFLKVALLCTQDYSKLRPTMSMVVKMLKNEIDPGNQQIKRPGLLSELMDLKVRNQKETSSAGSGSGPSQSASDPSGQSHDVSPFPSVNTAPVLYQEISTIS